MGVVRCSVCGKPVSNNVPEEIFVRAFVECPECIEEEQCNKEVLKEEGKIDPDSDIKGG